MTNYRVAVIPVWQDDTQRALNGDWFGEGFSPIFDRMAAERFGRDD